jgi:hypothetical protein
MHTAVCTLREAHTNTVVDRSTFFAGLHFCTTLDFMQHEPIQGRPLYQANPRGIAGTTPGALGRDLWAEVNTVHILKEQHRFGAPDPDSQLLYDIVQLLWSEEILTHAEVQHIVETLNKRYTGSNGLATLLARNPKAIVLRNAARPALNLKLAKTHAVNTHKRIVMWRSTDTTATPCLGRKRTNEPLSSVVLTHLELQHPGKTGMMPTVMLFFEGCDYIFGPENRCPEAGWCNNNLATGVRLILHAEEPCDNPEQHIRVLRFPPVGIVVRPHGVTVNSAFSDGSVVPEGCIVVSQKTIKFPLALDGARGKAATPIPMLKYPRDHAAYPLDDPASIDTVISISRTGFPLNLGYCVSDYFSQGMSFKDLPFLMDIRPPHGPYKAGSLRVPITRPSSMKDVHLLAPLYTNDAEKAEVVRKWTALLRPVHALKDEMARLRTLHATTQVAYDLAHVT